MGGLTFDSITCTVQSLVGGMTLIEWPSITCTVVVKHCVSGLTFDIIVKHCVGGMTFD